MSQEYKSITHGVLTGMPEILSRFPGKGNVAINIRHYDVVDTHYGVDIGERVGDSFEVVGESPMSAIPEGFDTNHIIEAELAPFGEKAVIFDVFVDGKLYREANK